LQTIQPKGRGKPDVHQAKDQPFLLPEFPGKGKKQTLCALCVTVVNESISNTNEGLSKGQTHTSLF